MDEIQRYEQAINRARGDGNEAAAQELQQRLNQLLSQQQVQQAPQPKASDTISSMQQSLKQSTGVTIPEGVISSLVGIGKGYTDVIEGIKYLVGQGKDPSDVQEWARFEEEYPVSAIGGRVVGQAAPFAALGPVGAGARTGGAAILGKTAQPLSRAARVGTGAGVGAAEGGIITAGATNETNAEDVITGAGLGGLIGAGVEVVFPHLGGLINRLRSKPLLKGDQLSPEAQAAMDAVGMSTDEIEKVKPVLQKIRTNPSEQLVGEDLERILRFESLDIPYTRGDVLGTGTKEGFEQRVMESRLLESSTDELAQPLRDVKRAQSATIQDLLETQVRKLGGADSKEAGDALKDALSGRRSELKKQQKGYYNQLATASENAEEIPLLVTGPDPKVKRRMRRSVGSQIADLDDLMLEFGIGEPEQLKAFIDAGNEVTPLSLSNSEEFRQALNLIERSDNTGAASVIIGPIKNDLDTNIDSLLGEIEKVAPNSAALQIGDAAKKARETTRKLKTEFSPQSIAGKLINVKPDGVSPIIAGSDVIRTIFPTGQRPKTEDIGLIVKQLTEAGAQGKRGLSNLQGATIQRMIDRGFKQESNRVGDQVLFSGNQFAKAFDEFGEENLDVMFSNNKPLLKQLKRMREVAQDLTIDSKTVPKGSSSTISDLMNKLGVATISSKLPGVGIAVEGLQSLQAKAQRRAQAKTIGKTGPRYTPKELKQIKIIRDTMPEMATALGITATLENDDEQIYKPATALC